MASSGVATSSKSIFGFDPRTVPGCQLWLDAADLATLSFSSGNIISTWKDKSINGVVLTAYGNPTTTTVNGRTSISLNGSTQYLQKADFTPTKGATYMSWFAVANVTNYANANYACIVGTAYNSQWSQNTLFVKTGTGLIFYRRADQTASKELSSGAVTANALFQTETDYVTGQYQINLNGSGLLSKTDGVTGAIDTLTVNLQVGWDSFSGDSYVAGTISECLLYTSTVSPANKRAIEGYLAWKWGLQSSLVKHPYSQLIPYSRSFQPTDIPGCQLWLDAADQSTLTLINSGANASNWRDKSGNSYNCSTSSGANSPAYSSSTQGLQFRSASTQSLAINQLFGDALVNTTFTIFCVGQRVSTGTFNLFLAGSPLTAFQTLQIGFNGVNTMHLNMYSTYYETTITSYVAGTEPINIYTYEVNTTNVALFLNGLTVYNTAATPRLAAFTTPEIGRRYGGTGAQTYHDFNLFEMIAYTRSLTTGQRQQIEGYLANKWRLQSSLESPTNIETTFSYTGAIQNYTVPSGVTSLTVNLSGAGGGAGNNNTVNGGSGALVSGTITVTSGQVLRILVGQGGMSNRGTATGGSASFGGGGAGGSYTPGGVAASGAGGGRSAIQNNSGDDLVSAGGGGGGGNGGPGGSGGLVGVSATGGSAGGGGGGGTGSSGGAGGIGTTYTGTAGTARQGGAGSSSSIVGTITGGGGGGGHFGGGGGGNSQSGGGGSSLCPSGTSATTGGGGGGGSSSTPNGDGINGSIIIRVVGISHSFKTIPPTSPSLFSPTNIGACAIWIDGNDPNGTGVVPASGATFATTSATIIDKSGNGYNLTPTATINYSTRFLNNMGVLNFGSARAQNSSFNWTTNFTQFVVVKGETGSWGTSFINPTGTIYWSYVYANNNNLMVVGINFNVMDGIRGNSISAFTNTGKGLNAWTIFCIGYTAGSTTGVNYTLNGTTYSTTTGTPFNSSQATNLTLTLNGNLNLTPYDTGVYVAEFIHYNARLSTNQRQQVEGYLAGKWGLQGLLPTTHPYYEIIPAAVSSYYFYESFEIPANLAATLNAPNAWGYSPAWNEWTVTGVSKSGVGSPWDPAGGTAAAGSWYAYIQGNGSTASRVFQGPLGYTATLSFSYGYRVGTSLVTSVSVTWTPLGGSAVTLPGSPFAMPSSATPWTTVTTSFVFTASSGTLIFTNNAPGQPDPSALLDNILIT
jgi:hypothetical protein